jgi:hypothetical protein
VATERRSIMLSSTYTELKDHRAAVSQGALGQGMFPLDIANDSAIPDKDLIDASLAKVDEADAYVGLISYRYGQTPKCPTNGLPNTPPRTAPIGPASCGTASMKAARTCATSASPRCLT